MTNVPREGGGNIKEGGNKVILHVMKQICVGICDQKNLNILDFYYRKLSTLEESTNRVENVDSLKTKRSREIQF